MSPIAPKEVRHFPAREGVRLPTDVPLILRALAFAADKHRDQRRKDVDATPYINHPIALACLLGVEAGIDDAVLLAAAILHDTIEDTNTTREELVAHFGERVAAIVAEVTDDKRLPRDERKRAQVDHAPHLSREARFVKLADKTCNLRDIASSAPAGWSLERQREYFEWAKAVVDQIRGTDEQLEWIFDQAYGAAP